MAGRANIGGGFHHACPNHGEGFCVIHDVAIAIRRLQFEGEIDRAMVVDTDVHQGNGTAVIFADDDTVFTLSIHQENNYPHVKPPSTVDINLPDGIGDDGYLSILEKHLQKAFRDFSPQLLFYVAGADPYREDQLGGLALTIRGTPAARYTCVRLCATTRRASGKCLGGRLRAAPDGYNQHPCRHNSGGPRRGANGFASTLSCTKSNLAAA